MLRRCASFVDASTALSRMRTSWTVATISEPKAIEPRWRETIVHVESISRTRPQPVPPQQQHARLARARGALSTMNQ